MCMYACACLEAMSGKITQQNNKNRSGWGKCVLSSLQISLFCLPFYSRHILILQSAKNDESISIWGKFSLKGMRLGTPEFSPMRSPREGRSQCSGLCSKYLQTTLNPIFLFGVICFPDGRAVMDPRSSTRGISISCV